MTRILIRRLSLVVLLGLATLRAAGAEGPGSPPAPAAGVRQGLPTMLSTATLGKVITEGVRLGDPAARVAARWGQTDCTPQGTRWTCVYAVAEDPNTTGELVAVQLEADRIVLFAVLPVPHARVIPLRTTAGIGTTATEDEVRRAYSPAEAAIREWLLYLSRGVGFALTRHEVVKHIVVFPPGTPAERLLDDLGGGQG
jgi:hypothetical protein